MKWWYWLILLLAGLFFSVGFYFNWNREPNVLSVYDEDASFFQKFLPVIGRDVKETKFVQVIERTEQRPGTYGIYIKDPYYNRAYQYNKDELFYGASLYKLPLAVAAFKDIQNQDRSADDVLVYRSQDVADGTGTINQLSIGTELTLDYVIDRLLKDSDNSAQNMLARTLEPQRISEAFAIMTVNNYFYISNNVTPYQMGNYFDELIKGNYLNLNHVELLLNKMSDTYFDDRIHAGLDEDVKFSHKIGNWGQTGTWHDCGVASKDNYKIVVCVMSRQTTYEDFLEVTKDVGEFVNILF